MVAVAADDAGDVRAMPVGVVDDIAVRVFVGLAREVLAIDDARLGLRGVPEIEAAVIDAAVNDGDADAGTVRCFEPVRVIADGGVVNVVEGLERMVHADVGDLRIVFQSRERADRQLKGRSLNHVQLAREEAALVLQARQSFFFRRPLVLHDDTDALVSAETLPGLSEFVVQFGRYPRRQRCMLLLRSIPYLRERHACDQQ